MAFCSPGSVFPGFKGSNYNFMTKDDYKEAVDGLATNIAQRMPRIDFRAASDPVNFVDNGLLSSKGCASNVYL